VKELTEGELLYALGVGWLWNGWVGNDGKVRAMKFELYNKDYRHLLCEEGKTSTLKFMTFSNQSHFSNSRMEAAE
jgi:hypothetical protein